MERTMKIVRVAATALNVPLRIVLPGIDRMASLEACFVEVETDTGIVGHGLGAITRETVIAEILEHTAEVERPERSIRVLVCARAHLGR